MIKNIPLKISNRLKYYPLLHDFLRKIYCLFCPGIRHAIQKTFEDHKTIVVLKIGANDGVMADPLGEFLLTDRRFVGVLVEPIPAYAALLRANYSDTGRFDIVEAAISDEDGSCELFFIDEDAAKSLGAMVPDWARGLASMSRLHLEKHLPEGLRGAVKSQIVESLSVATLLQRHNMSLVNMIHIDTEGADYLILNQFDFCKLRPEIVLFEHKHLPRDQKVAALSLMQKQGYRVRELEDDCLCLLATIKRVIL
jgi:FkbM family methyltransferase